MIGLNHKFMGVTFMFCIDLRLIKAGLALVHNTCQQWTDADDGLYLS